MYQVEYTILFASIHNLFPSNAQAFLLGLSCLSIAFVKMLMNGSILHYVYGPQSQLVLVINMKKTKSYGVENEWKK